MNLPKLRIGSHRFTLRTLDDGRQIFVISVGAGRNNRIFSSATNYKAFDSAVDSAILNATDGGGPDLSERMDDFLKNIRCDLTNPTSGDIL